MLTLMRGIKIQYRAYRHNARWVDGGVTAVIVFFDMLHVHRVGHARPLVKLAHVTGQMRIIFDPLQVAFEMPVVDGIEPEQRDKQPPIRLDELGTEELAPVAEPRVELIQRNED